VPAVEIQLVTGELPAAVAANTRRVCSGVSSVVSERQRVSISTSTLLSVVVTMRPVGPSFTIRRALRRPSPSTVPWTRRPSDRSAKHGDDLLVVLDRRPLGNDQEAMREHLFGVEE